MKPKMFGYPLWKGRRVRSRLARKYFNKLLIKAAKDYGDLKVGDLIFTCSGHNSKITSIEPEYRRMKGKFRFKEDRHGNLKIFKTRKIRGEVLVNLFIYTETGSHSLLNCTEPAWSYEKVKSFYDELMSTEEYKDRYKVIEILPDGTITRKEEYR
jgi:hypothetical protein